MYVRASIVFSQVVDKNVFVMGVRAETGISEQAPMGDVVVVVDKRWAVLLHVVVISRVVV